MPDFLFVYGILRPALAVGRLRALTRQLRWVGSATAPGRLHDLGRYPAAVLDEASTTRVVGDVLELPSDPAVLAELDRYEGFEAEDPEGSLYRRSRRPVRLEDGRAVDCWVYVYNRSLGEAPLVPDGDYVAWRVRQG